MQTFKPTPLHEFEASNQPAPQVDPASYSSMPPQGYTQGEGMHPMIVEKNKQRTLILIVSVITLIVFVIIIALMGSGPKVGRQNLNNINTPTASVGTLTPMISDDGSITITSPKNGDAILPPLVITGLAKGYWFNQGFFPVSIYDTDKNLVHQTYAIAQGDWANTEAVIPFKATIDSFDKAPVKRAGHIVFQKGNIIQGMADKDFLVAIEFAKKGAKSATVTKTTTSTTDTAPACRDQKDNDGDGLIDARDPGCHNDGNAANSASYMINGVSEITVAAPVTQPSETYEIGRPCGGYSKGIPGVPDGKPLDCFGMPM